MQKRIELDEVLQLIYEKYGIDPNKYEIVPHVDFGDCGDGIQYENIYFDVFKKATWECLFKT